MTLPVLSGLKETSVRLCDRYLKGTMILPVLSGLKALMGMGVRSPITMTLPVSSGLKENFLYRPQGRW
ncbi:hypothetical protein [Nostoc flagelliforme]|uniref:hypothetical protein n=1 Tax=Nostoc flagelliforme TaxID=1306274 RepID=UPI003BB21504